MSNVSTFFPRRRLRREFTISSIRPIAAWAAVFRLDLASGNWERFHPTDFLPPGHRYSIYQLISDSMNNVWMAEFEERYLGKIDAKTLKVTWFPLPSPHGRARRMEIDDQDRILVTEYRANKVALFGH
jgi:virginiamycin B lyase